MWLKKLKILFHGHILLVIYYSEKIIRTFYEKELQKTNQKEFRIEKKLRRKVINYMSNGKDMIIHLIAGLIKKMLYKNELIFS